MNKYLLGITLLALSCERYTLEFFVSSSVQADRKEDTIKSILVQKKKVKENYLASLAEFSPSTIPESVKNYFAHVKKLKLRYAAINDPSRYAVFPGANLDERKQGVCDEFALNALFHLRTAKDLAALYLVSIRGTAPNGDSVYHASVAYQMKNRRFRLFSNGKDEGIEGVSLDEIIHKSDLNWKKIGYVWYEKKVNTLNQIPTVLIEGKESIDMSYLFNLL